MAYKKKCKWCYRYDCKENGGHRQQCPADDKVENDEITFQAMITYQREQGFIPLPYN